MLTRRSILCCALCAPLLAGCASTDTSYPSLTVRDFERAEGQFEPGPRQQLDVPAIDVNFDGDLATHLAGLLAQAEAAHQQFEATMPAAQSRVLGARDAGIESNAWAAAQVALADLDSHRSQTAIVLAELDMLFAAASIQYQDNEQIAQTRSQVAALIIQEDVVLNGLREALR